MVKRNIVLLDIDYITFEEKPVVRLFGKIKEDNSKDLIALDDSFVPYLYVLPSSDIDQCIEDLEELVKEGELEFTEMEKVLKKDFQVPTEFINEVLIREFVRITIVSAISNHDEGTLALCQIRTP